VAPSGANKIGRPLPGEMLLRDELLTLYFRHSVLLSLRSTVPRTKLLGFQPKLTGESTPVTKLLTNNFMDDGVYKGRQITEGSLVLARKTTISYEVTILPYKRAVARVS
jgi:hypothetical protein